MADFAIEGAGQLADLGKALKAAGDKDLRRETLRTLRERAKPMGERAKRYAVVALPHRGGLGNYVARTRVTVRTRLSGRDVGVRIAGVRRKDGGTVDLDAMDRGQLRHKTFGHKPWVEQSIHPGWWSIPMAAEAPATQVALSDAVQELLARAVAQAARK